MTPGKSIDQFNLGEAQSDGEQDLTITEQNLDIRVGEKMSKNSDSDESSDSKSSSEDSSDDDSNLGKRKRVRHDSSDSDISVDNEA